MPEFVFSCYKPLSVSGNYHAPGFPHSNLLSPQPKVVFRVPIADQWVTGVTFDMGWDWSMDTFALLFHNASPDLSWSVEVRTDAEGPNPNQIDTSDMAAPFQPATPVYPTATSLWTRRHSVLLLPQIVYGRYVRFILYASTAADADFSVGLMTFGQRIQPEFGRDWGAGRRIVDQSTRITGRGGEQHLWRGARVPSVRWSWSHLSDAEMLRVWALMADAGESQPIVYVEDSSPTPGLHERIHYGLLTGLDYYERAQTEKSQISLKLDEWL